jgi:hypothetical protein
MSCHVMSCHVHAEDCAEDCAEDRAENCAVLCGCGAWRAVGRGERGESGGLPGSLAVLASSCRGRST